ncbi:K(lysine) acetyltransferase [Linnemannia zychae]|nr:K(lysine) acetyltransferase [Linnemannia zychae]
MESNKKDSKEHAIEIGGFYAIIGKDFREYKVEVLGKRVSELETVVYIHYEGTDKRLDEWVDITRLMPLKDQKKSSLTTTGTQDSSGSKANSTTMSTSTDEPEIGGGRPKRKIIKDEVAVLLESMKRPTSRMRSGEVGSDGGFIKPISPHGHDHDEEDVPQVRNVEWILYAGYDIATWYYSPYPDEYQDCQRLFICEYCLKYIRQVESFINHTKNMCKRKRPPGTVVYSKGINKIYKVDGKTNKLYCQNLCLLAKLFLDNKTLYFDVPGFQFFVLTETRSGDRADVPVGFFSKEIVSYDGYNLACILVLPPFQRKSYGKLLIEFSYELTKIEGKVGSPEKPLSDLGKLGYVSYWITAILRELYPRPWPAKRPPPPLPNSRRRNRASSSVSGSDAGGISKATKAEGNNSGLSQDASVEVTSKVKQENKADKSVLSDFGKKARTMDIDVPENSAQNSQPQKDREIAFSIRELAAKTGIMEEDLLETLVTMGWMSHWQPPMAASTVPIAVRNAKRNYRKLKRFQEQLQLLEKYRSSAQHHEDGHSHSHSHGHSHGHGHGHGHDLEAFGNFIKGHHGSRHGSGSSLGHIHNSSSHGSNIIVSNSGIGSGGSLDGISSSLSDQPLIYEFDPVSILEIPDSESETVLEGLEIGDDGNRVATSKDNVSNGSGGSSGDAGGEKSSTISRGGNGERNRIGESGEVKTQQSGDEIKIEGGINASTTSLHQQHHPAITSSKAAASASSGGKDVVAVVTMEMVKEYQDRYNIRLDPYLDWNAIDWVAYRSTLELV